MPPHPHSQRSPEPPEVYARRRFLVGAALAVVPVSAWWLLGRDSSAASTTPASGSLIPTPTTPAPNSVPQQPSEVGDVTPLAGTDAPTPVLDHVLSLGMVEPAVGVAQQRLTDLGFDPGPIDNIFGEATIRSVWAFEKLVVGTPREQISGVVTPEIWDRIHQPSSITARRTTGARHLEVYLPEQVAALFVDGKPRLISHVSSGQGIEWCDEVTIDNDDGTQSVKGICGRSVTPGGVYHFERQVEGWRNAKLGRLYKPIYFNYGIAVHGASNVPNYPASRGCVRFPMHIAEYLQEVVELGDAVFVFDGVEEPETYGAQPMIFDWPDPDYTTTTTSTTSTTTSTTTPTTTPTTTTATPAPPSTSPTTTSTAPPAATPTTTSPPTTAPTSTSAPVATSTTLP